MTGFSSVIVNYKTPQLCIDCLRSLFVSSCTQIVIVDNASNDGSLNALNSFVSETGSKTISVLESHANGGFSSGNNLGIKSCNGKYILLLNSDTIVRPGAIELLIKTLDDNPEIGIVSPLLESPNGEPQESCFRFHRPINEIIKSAASGPITKLFSKYEVPLRVSAEISYPEWTSFACVLIRKKLFEDIGLLDDKFFMYFEDVDFCRRTHDAGWKISNNPEARVIHLGSGSSNVGNTIASLKRPPRYWYESRTRYYYKYFGMFGLFAANLFWHFGWLVAMCRNLFSRHYQPNIYDKQWRDIWINFFKPTAPYIHPDNY